MAKGYIVVNINIHDQDAWPAYRERSRPFVARNGGRYLVATSDIDQREGDMGLKRLVVIEFPSVEIARRVYESDEYQRDILPFRTRASDSDLVIVEGLESAP